MALHSDASAATVLRDSFRAMTGMSMGLGMIRVGEDYLIRDIDALPNDEDVNQFVDGFREAYPAATGGAVKFPPPASQPAMP